MPNAQSTVLPRASKTKSCPPPLFTLPALLLAEHTHPFALHCYRRTLRPPRVNTGRGRSGPALAACVSAAQTLSEPSLRKFMLTSRVGEASERTEPGSSTIVAEVPPTV